MKPSQFLILSTFAWVASAAHAAVITDFTSFTSATTNLLPSTNTRTQTFSTTTGPGTNSIIGTATGGSNAGQAVYLSEDFSLATVGSRISASLGGFAGTPNVAQAIGLAVASSDAITSRVNLITFYYRVQSTNRLGYATFGAAGETVSSTPNSSAIPDSIFIERTATGYLLGSITGVTETTFTTLNFGTQVTADGTAVGIYSDVRNANNVNTLIDFAHIPEPSAALLGGIGLLALLRRRR